MSHGRKQSATDSFGHTTKVADTAAQLLNPSRRDHEPRFDKILPRQMADLVKRGLFEPDGQGSYRITALGRAHLRALEDK